MMHFKNEGFTLIEAMFAVLILGMVLAPLFVLENSVLQGVGTATEKFNQWLAAQNFLYEARRSQPKEATEFSLEKKEKEPVIQLKYNLKPISDPSALKKKKNLYQETVTATGPLKKGPSQDLTCFRFKPARHKAIS